MLMMRFPLKKSLAMLLPICFLWLFVACVSHCSMESAERLYACAHLSIEMTDEPDSETCLIVDAPKAVIPERAALNLQTPYAIQYSIFPAKSSTNTITFSIRLNEPAFADPPLERLPDLRI
jgi:hypothetical protein